MVDGAGVEKGINCKDFRFMAFITTGGIVRHKMIKMGYCSRAAVSS